jgi:hypothetical protein
LQHHPFLAEESLHDLRVPILRIGVEEEIWPEEIWRTIVPETIGSWVGSRGKRQEGKRRRKKKIRKSVPPYKSVQRKKVGENLYRYLSVVSGSRVAGKLSPPFTFGLDATRYSITSTNCLSKSDRYRLNQNTRRLFCKRLT